MSEKKKDQVIPSYMKGFDATKIANAMKVEILPTISVDKVGLEYSIDVEVISIPREIELPKAKQQYGKLAYPMEVRFSGQKCQIYCTNALRHSFGILDMKLTAQNKSIIGRVVKIWKAMTMTDFGMKPLYQISLVD